MGRVGSRERVDCDGQHSHRGDGAQLLDDYNWTMADGATLSGALTASADSEQQQQEQPSPAMQVVGQGNDEDPFMVYLAEPNPSGPGHVVVVPNATGGLMQQYRLIQSHTAGLRLH